MLKRMDEYKCCFDDSKDCSVRNLWKLQPENLVKFCKLCRPRTSTEQTNTQVNLDGLKYLSTLLDTERQENSKLRKLLFDTQEK